MEPWDYSEYPDLFASDDEVAIMDAAMIEQWLAVMRDRLEEMAEELGWQYRIGTVALSRNERFTIFRAQVKWRIDQDSVETVELIWEDTHGRKGLGSGFIDSLGAPAAKFIAQPPDGFRSIPHQNPIPAPHPGPSIRPGAICAYSHAHGSGG